MTNNLDKVIERLENDVSMMRLTTDAVHYYAGDKVQLANDIQSLINTVKEDKENWKYMLGRLTRYMELHEDKNYHMLAAKILADISMLSAEE